MWCFRTVAGALCLGLLVAAAPGCGSDECEPGDSRKVVCEDETHVVTCRSDGTWRSTKCEDLKLAGDTSGKPPAQLDYDPSKSTAVLDKTTGLIWQRLVDAVKRSREGGLAYCDSLVIEDPVLGTLSDLRLPSRDELETIVLTTTTNPAIDDKAFPDTPSEPFWTATKLNDKQGLGVDFGTGGTGYQFFTEKFHIRCVQ